MRNIRLIEAATHEINDLPCFRRGFAITDRNIPSPCDGRELSEQANDIARAMQLPPEYRVEQDGHLWIANDCDVCKKPLAPNGPYALVEVVAEEAGKDREFSEAVHIHCVEQIGTAWEDPN